MIFVTVGTHEQQFDRLVRAIDSLKLNGAITEDVIIQTGYCTYEPKACQWSRFYPYEQMLEHVQNARIVITHGGPSSFIMPLQIGKIPIVVPRQSKYQEHVNDHQVEFCQVVAQRQATILVVDQIEKLSDNILTYETRIAELPKCTINNNLVFCGEIEKIVQELFSTTC